MVVGGRTGRDGIHGATFSSAELTSQSEEISGAPCKLAIPSPRKCWWISCSRPGTEACTGGLPTVVPEGFQARLGKWPGILGQ